MHPVSHRRTHSYRVRHESCPTGPLVRAVLASRNTRASLCVSLGPPFVELNRGGRRPRRPRLSPSEERRSHYATRGAKVRGRGRGLGSDTAAALTESARVGTARAGRDLYGVRRCIRIYTRMHTLTACDGCSPPVLSPSLADVVDDARCTREPILRRPGAIPLHTFGGFAHRGFGSAVVPRRTKPLTSISLQHGRRQHEHRPYARYALVRSFRDAHAPVRSFRMQGCMRRLA